MRVLSTALWVVVAIVNILPALGALSTPRIATFYGVTVDDPNLAVLLRHRAVLFAIVGGLLAIAAFHAPLRPVAFVSGLVNMVSFVVVARLVGSHNAKIGRVAAVDAVATILLFVAVGIDFVASPG